MLTSRVPARLFGPLVGLLVLALASPGCGHKREDIAIGEYGSTTGLTSTFGTSSDNGVQLAIAGANAAGGINGKKLEVILYDDEGKPDTAVNVVKKLVYQDKVAAVIGEVASKRSIAAAPTCQSGKTPMISPSSTNPKVTEIGDYIFRVCFIDPFQGTAAAKFASQKGFKRAAIMTDALNDYSTGLTQFFQESFPKQGGAIVATQRYQAGDLDFKAQLTAIKASNPDILFVPGYYGDVGPIARQAREVGLNVPLLGGDGWDSPKLVPGAGGPGKALEGSYFTNHYSLSDPSPRTKAFIAAFQAKFHTMPDALAAMGYDAAGVLLDAMKRVGAPADGDYESAAYRAKLRDVLAQTKNYPGVTGDITIDAARNAVKPAVILQIKGNDFKYVSSIKP